MVYEKKKVEKRSQQNGSSADIPASKCGFCQRPNTNVKCHDCKNVHPKMRVRKICKDHPKQFLVMGIAKCVKCQSTNIEEVGDDEVPVAVPSSYAPCVSLHETPVSNATVPEQSAPPQQTPVSKATVPEQSAPVASRPRRARFEFNPQEIVQMESASPRRVRSNIQIPMDVSYAPERFSARQNIQVNIPERSSQVLFNPFNPTSQQRDEKSSEFPISGTRSFSGIENSNTPTPRRCMEETSVFDTIDSLSSVRISLSTTNRSTPEPNRNIPVSNCACNRPATATWILCTSCGHYEKPGSGHKKHIPCVAHPQVINGLKYCPQCHAPSSELEEGTA